MTEPDPLLPPPETVTGLLRDVLGADPATAGVLVTADRAARGTGPTGVVLEDVTRTVTAPGLTRSLGRWEAQLDLWHDGSVPGLPAAVVDAISRRRPPAVTGPYKAWRLRAEIAGRDTDTEGRLVRHIVTVRGRWTR